MCWWPKCVCECSKADVQSVYNALHVDNVTLFMTIMSIISVGNVVVHLTHPHAIETEKIPYSFARIALLHSFVWRIFSRSSAVCLYCPFPFSALLLSPPCTNFYFHFWQKLSQFSVVMTRHCLLDHCVYGYDILTILHF